jgi:hypothetical protein
MNTSITRAMRALGTLAAALMLATAAHAVNLPKPPSPPKPGEQPEIPDTQILDKLPEGTEMPEPGQVGVVVSCLQKGNMDITRPGLPLLSCWESATTGSDDVEALHKACTVQMTPMKIDSTLVPKCPPKALGTCIGAKSGGAADSEKSTSNHYHYTPQTLFEWRKSKKNCEASGGKWYGLGNKSRLF